MLAENDQQGPVTIAHPKHCVLWLAQKRDKYLEKTVKSDKMFKKPEMFSRFPMGVFWKRQVKVKKAYRR